MGDKLRRKFPFPSGPSPYSDPQASSSELTRRKSDFSGSGVTSESFRDPTANAKQGQTMVWTNEKHNSYLDFLEASFVKQLHSSMSLHGCHPQEEMWELCPSLELPANRPSSSHQFSVLQDGCCQKINHKSNDPLLDSTADSCDIMGSPLSHCFTSAGKSTLATFPVPRETVVPNDEICLRSDAILSCKSARSSEQHTIFLSCNYSLEVSDQNFVEEDQREKVSCALGAKRLKMMAMLDASSNSQVVPLGKLRTVDDSIMSNASAKRGKRKLLLSEHPESLSCPKSAITLLSKGELICFSKPKPLVHVLPLDSYNTSSESFHLGPL